jgi:hypothetical protein
LRFTLRRRKEEVLTMAEYIVAECGGVRETFFPEEVVG